MKDNKTIIVTLLFISTMACFNNISWAQDVSIYLSFLEKSAPGDTLSPSLQIEYINNSSRNYYFPALVPFDNYSPCYSTSTLISDSEECRGHSVSNNYYDHCHKTLHIDKSFQGKHYFLPLEFLQHKYASWELLTDTVFTKGEEHEQDLINDYLFSYAYYSHIIEPHKDIPYYNKSNLRNCKKLMLSPSFVFLKSHGRATQLISLYGIEGTGITLTVCLSAGVPPEAVYVSAGKENTYHLPRKVRGYHLYMGIVESNTVSSVFD